MAAYSPTALLLACDSKKKILKYFIILKINPQTDFGIFQTLVLFFFPCVKHFITNPNRRLFNVSIKLFSFQSSLYLDNFS